MTPAIARRAPVATVASMTEDEVDFAAVLHLHALPSGFFAALGRRFLRSYYATFVASPHAIAFTARIDGRPVGMIAGPVHPRAHVRWALRNKGWRLAAAGAAALTTRPRVAARFVRTRLVRYARAWWRGRHGDAPPPPAGTSEPAVLSHVAVIPEARGLGVGSTLVDAFTAEAARAGARRAVLTTLDGTAGSGGFYERAGWRTEGIRFGFDGQRMVLYELELPSGD
jgi:GNAT superfamily N-acetyltransferase